MNASLQVRGRKNKWRWAREKDNKLKQEGWEKGFLSWAVSFELEPFNQAGSRLGHLVPLPESRIHAGLDKCPCVHGRAAWEAFNNSLQVHSCLLTSVLLKHIHCCKAAKPHLCLLPRLLGRPWWLWAGFSPCSASCPAWLPCCLLLQQTFPPSLSCGTSAFFLF